MVDMWRHYKQFLDKKRAMIKQLLLLQFSTDFQLSYVKWCILFSFIKSLSRIFKIFEFSKKIFLKKQNFWENLIFSKNFQPKLKTGIYVLEPFIVNTQLKFWVSSFISLAWRAAKAERLIHWFLGLTKNDQKYDPGWSQTRFLSLLSLSWDKAGSKTCVICQKLWT